MSELVEYLQKIATQRGLDSTRKFADATGIGKTTAHNLFAGRKPKPETLEAIADSLDLPLARMRRLADLPDEMTPFVLPVEFGALTPSQRRSIIAVGREYLKANRGLGPSDAGLDNEN